MSGSQGRDLLAEIRYRRELPQSNRAPGDKKNGLGALLTGERTSGSAPGRADRDKLSGKGKISAGREVLTAR
jgi:hypothetical protein